MEIRKRTLAYLIISILLIAVVIGSGITGFSIFNQDKNSYEMSEELAKYISEHAVYYGQTGCSACKIQENLFGEYLIYLNKVNCKENPVACNEAEITATPTWIINGEKYIGVQSIERLIELTGYN